MSDNEQFGISDYDRECAMDPIGFGFRKKFTKEDAIYGIWNQNNDSSDEDEMSYRKYRKKASKYSSSKPINFINVGVDEQHKKKVESDEEMVEIAEESDDSDDLNRKRSLDDFVKPKLPLNAFRKNSTNSKQSNAALEQWGNWEQNTSGFGSKMLLKFGYKAGTGLGKDGKGIVTPIIVNNVKQNKKCIGNQGNTTTIKPLREEDIKEASKNNIKSETHGQNLYKSNNKTKQTYTFKKFDEIIAESNNVTSNNRKPPVTLSSESSKIKVVDMTSSEVKVYTGYQNMFKQRPEDEDNKMSIRRRRNNLTWMERHKLSHKEKSFGANGLIQNVDMILKNTTDQLVTDMTILNEKNEVLSKLDIEIKDLDKKFSVENEELSEINSILQFIDEFHEAMNSYDPNSLQEFGEWVGKAIERQQHYPQLILAVVKPLLKQVVYNWKPLDRPYQGILEYFVICEELLSGLSWLHESLIKVTWMSVMEQCINNDWHPPVNNASTTLLSLLDVWRPHLPANIIIQLIMGPIFTKLTVCLHQWQPTSDPIPVHNWLLPWMMDASTRYNLPPTILQPLIDCLCQKLDRCLCKWYPSDTSAHAVLLPWHSVFPTSHMANLIHKHILPKIKSCLRKMKIEPNNNTDTSPFDWTILWADLMSTETLVDLLATEFFPKWLQTLSLWLNSVKSRTVIGDNNGKEYAEVGQWYRNWWQRLPSHILEQPTIDEYKQIALNMMAASHHGKHVSCPSSASSASVPNSMSSNYSGSYYSNHPSTINMRSRIEEFAQSMGAAFYPLPNKFSNTGLQIYRYGDAINVCCNSTALYHFSQGNVQEITIADLDLLYRNMMNRSKPYQNYY